MSQRGMPQMMVWVLVEEKLLKIQYDEIFGITEKNLAC